MPLITLTRRLATALTAFALCSLLLSRLAAQSPGTGTIEGRVSNSAAGQFLKQVRIVVDGTVAEALTNEAGEFRLTGVPAGAVTLRATATSLDPQTARLTVAAGQVAHQDFDFNAGGTSASAMKRDAAGTVVSLEAFTVAERELSAQSAALQEQRTAANIKNVVAFEEFGDLGDGNPGEFLKFVPGVQVAMSPAIPTEITLRGMPTSGTLLMVDGVELSSDGPAGRGASFTASNVANMDRIEITKVPTPDMPANAVGGMINVIGKSGFARRTPLFSYSLFGLLTTKEPLTSLGREMFRGGSADKSTGGPHLKPGFELNYLRPINDKLSLSLSAGHNVRWEDKDNIAPTWNRVALIQTQSAVAAQIATRERTVLSTRVDWRPFPAHTLFATFSFTNDNVSSRIFTDTQAYGAGATGGEHFTQGAATAVGTATMATTYREQLKDTGAATLGYRFESGAWKLAATLARSQSRRRTLSARDGHDYFGGTSSTIPSLILRADGFGGERFGTPPVVRGTTRAGVPVPIDDARFYSLNTVTSPEEPLMTNALTTVKLNASRDLGLPFSARIMTGVDASRNERDLRVETRTWSFRPTSAVGSPERLVGSYDLVNYSYSSLRTFNNGERFQWIDPRKVYDLYKAQPSYFVFNDSAYYISKVNGSQKLEETVSAGFLRTDVKFFKNRLWLVAGARYERTDEKGVGGLNDIRATYQQDAQGNLIRNAAGQPIRVVGDALTLAKLQYTERGSATKKNYGDLYPSVNASYAFTENFVARAAFAETIGRPDISSIIPSRSVSDPAAAEATRVINTNNAGLKPWTADNYDISLESYSVKGATISASLFRKNITGFFVSTRTDATPALLADMGLSDDYLDYDVITQTNSVNTVRTDGLEWSWRQSFQPFKGLPQWVRGAQFWVNGTHLRISGSGADEFTGYAPRVLNWGASYASSKFLVRYNVSRIGRQRASLSAVSATVPAGTYDAQDTRMVQDANIEYRFSRKFALYASVRNLANEPRPLITYSPNAPAYTRPRTYNFYGALWTMGVKGAF